MPRAVFATVCGVDFTSKTALQKEWRARVKRYPHPKTALGHKKVGKDAAVASLSPKDVEWFVSAAAAVQGHTQYLFGNVDKAGSALQLARALEHTTAYISNIPTGIGTSRRARTRRSKGPEHRCVYFRSLTNPLARPKAVPNTLGETAEVKQKKQCNRWLVRRGCASSR